MCQKFISVLIASIENLFYCGLNNNLNRLYIAPYGMKTC